MGMCDPKAIRDGKSWADVVNRRPARYCSQPGCVHGASHLIKKTDKPVCALCARLLYSHELVLLPTKQS